MADDRYRRTAANPTPPAAGAKRAATAAARQPGPDPLVELARLIGQNEIPAQDPHQVVRRREGPGAAAQRPAQRPPSPSQPSPSEQRQPTAPTQQPPEPVQRRPAAPTQQSPSVQRQPTPPAQQPTDPAMQRRQPAPSQQPPVEPAMQRRQAMPAPPAPDDRDAERGTQFERHPDQRYDGYTDPKPAASPQARGQAGGAHAWKGAPPDLSDPYSTDAGWRPPPRPKERRAQPDNAAAYRPGYGGEAKSPAERTPPRAFEPAPPVAESRRPQAPAAGHQARYEPAGYEPPGEKAYAQAENSEDARAVAAELGPQPDRYDEYDAYGYSGGDYEAGAEPRSRKLWIVAAILALAVIGTAGAYSYRAMIGGETQETATPVIRADQSPKKIASVAQPNGDKQIQERVGDRSAGERVVSREEQPLAIKDPNARALVPEPPPAASVPVTTELGGVQSPGSPTGTTGEPKKVRTVTIRPEGGPAEPSPAPNAPPRATAPAAPARAARPPASPGEPQQAAPARSQTALAAPPPRPSAGNYVVQLSAQKSEGDAQASFRAMQAKYPSVLGGRQAIIRRKEQAGKGVYFGAQVGPFAAREEAVQLCESLKSAGGSCFVERN